MTRARIALLALAAASTLLLSGCIAGTTKSVDLIYRADFSQSQAVPDFDDGDYRIDDHDAAIAELRQLFRDHGIEPWNYTPRETDGCTGGISTTVTLLYRGAGESTMVIDGCAAEDGSFEADATEFFAEYRETGGEPQSAPNDEIVSLTFSQSQAIEGFDGSEYTQDHPQQVAKFVALLDADDVVWSEGVDPALLGEPCPGSITTEITATYTGTDVVVGPVSIGGCADLSFVDEVTALFAGWRESLAS